MSLQWIKHRKTRDNFCDCTIAQRQKLLVRAVGIEPTLLAEPDFESGASTSSTTPASACAYNASVTGCNRKGVWAMSNIPSQPVAAKRFARYIHNLVQNN
jgi:hypothetical protein